MEPISRRRALVLGGAAAVGVAGSFAAAGGAGAATGWKRLVVVTANIGRTNPGQREHAIRDVRHALTVDGRLTMPLVGWQEIGEGDGDALETRWIARHFASNYRNLFTGGTPHRVPVSIPKTYDVLERRVTLVHGGKADVSPHRVITQAVLRRADDPRIRFVFANTHYVAGAWNGEPDRAEAWRDRQWRVHFRKHRDAVLGHWRAKGFPVIWTGDVNHPRLPLLLPNFEKRVFGRGYDQIGWVSGNGTQIRLRGRKVVPMHVDGHDARVAIMEIRHA